MFELYFYQDRRGNEPVWDYLQEIKRKSERDKNSRVQFNKLNDYLQALSEYGLAAGEPYIKHLEGDIWELRPLRNRVLFAAWSKNGFVLLHMFMKTTQKTPRREIEQAKRNLADFHERSNKSEARKH